MCWGIELVGIIRLRVPVRKSFAGERGFGGIESAIFYGF